MQNNKDINHVGQPGKKTRIVIIVLLLVYFSLFFLYQQYFTNFDYGKLVKYGQVILAQGKIFETNFFSYNYPDYPFINHHWGTGVIFHLVHKLGGLEALTVLAVIINLIAFMLILKVSVKGGNFMAVVLITLLTFPLLTSRNQPRPEMFSILFFVLTIIILFSYYRGTLNKKYLWILPIVQLFWVNVHILFFLGIFLQGTLLLQLLINKTNKKQLLWFLMIFTVSILACFINPSGFAGAIYPFKIMGEIQYGISENTPLYILVIENWNTLYFYQIEFLFVLGALMLFYWARNFIKAKKYLFVIIWLLAFGFLFLYRIRAGIFFAYVLVLMVGLITEIADDKKQKLIKRSATIMTILLLFVIFVTPVGYYWPYQKRAEQPGLGVDKKMKGAANYFLNNKIKGPIFNNFDIGDYLIYYLFPQEKIFVDSRPEAYPPEFFKDELLPAFRDYKKFLLLDYKYNFNVVFLANHRQVKKITHELFYDSRWFLAYSDKYCVIFLKRNPENDKLVRKELLNKRNLRIINRNIEWYMKYYQRYY